VFIHVLLCDIGLADNNPAGEMEEKAVRDAGTERIR